MQSLMKTQRIWNTANLIAYHIFACLYVHKESTMDEHVCILHVSCKCQHIIMILRQHLKLHVSRHLRLHVSRFMLVRTASARSFGMQNCAFIAKHFFLINEHTVHYVLLWYTVLLCCIDVLDFAMHSTLWNRLNRVPRHWCSIARSSVASLASDGWRAL